jgi:hypothetical protein
MSEAPSATDPGNIASVQTSAGGRSRPVLIAVVVIAAIIVIGMAVVLLRPSGPTAYPVGSPEAAFQAQLAAYEANDLETAYSYFSSAVRSAMPVAGYRQATSDYSWQQQQDRRVVLENVVVTGERAVISLRVEQFDQGGFGGSRSSWERDVRMVHEPEGWRVDESVVGVESAPYYGP